MAQTGERILWFIVSGPRSPRALMISPGVYPSGHAEDVYSDLDACNGVFAICALAGTVELPLAIYAR